MATVFEFAVVGDFDAILSFLNSGQAVNQPDSNYWTLLHHAAYNGWLSCVRLLLERHADVNAKTAILQWTPLQAAIENGHTLVVRYLIQHGAPTNSEDTYHRKPKDVAERNQLWEIVELLNRIDFVIREMQSDQETEFRGRELNHFVSEGNLEAVTQMLQGGLALANFSDYLNYDQFPLHLAALNGFEKIIEELIAHKADVNARNRTRQTPLHYAAFQGFDKAARLLIQHGADINAKEKASATPLHYAVSKGHFEVVKLLLECDANIRIYDQSNQTPVEMARMYPEIQNLFAYYIEPSQRLYNAVLVNDEGVVESLLESSKVDVNFKETVSGTTALHVAAEYGLSNMVAKLLNKSANPYLMNNLGWTAIHLAAFYGRLPVLQEFMKRRIDVQGFTLVENKTAITLAFEQGHHEIAQALGQYQNSFTYVRPVEQQRQVGHRRDLSLDQGEFNKPSKVVRKFSNIAVDEVQYHSLNSSINTMVPIVHWSESDVQNWLICIGLDHPTAKNFFDNKITGYRLTQEMTPEALTALGVSPEWQEKIRCEMTKF